MMLVFYPELSCVYSVSSLSKFVVSESSRGYTSSPIQGAYNMEYCPFIILLLMRKMQCTDMNCQTMTMVFLLISSLNNLTMGWIPSHQSQCEGSQICQVLISQLQRVWKAANDRVGQPATALYCPMLVIASPILQRHIEVIIHTYPLDPSLWIPIY